jgi:hypothetical protein
MEALLGFVVDLARVCEAMRPALLSIAEFSISVVSLVAIVLWVAKAHRHKWRAPGRKPLPKASRGKRNLSKDRRRG